MSKDLIVPYRLEDRKERYKRIVYKQIQDYIKNASKGHLYLYGVSIESLPSNLKTVGGDLSLENTFIESLPSDLMVLYTLDLRNSQISSLPSNLKVGGSLWLYNTPLSEKYTVTQIRQMIEDSGGYVKEEIYVYF